MVKRLKPTGAKKSRNTLKKRKLQEKVYSDKHSGKELPALNNGDKVAICNMEANGCYSNQ